MNADDLTTLFVPHLEALADALAPGTEDFSTLLMKDYPVVRADAGSLKKDVNTDYGKYLN